MFIFADKRAAEGYPLHPRKRHDNGFERWRNIIYTQKRTVAALAKAREAMCVIFCGRVPMRKRKLSR